MRILVTNDDGYDQPGLHALVERLVADHGRDVWVFAPAWEHSGAGAAIGPLEHHPPVIREVEVPGVTAGQAWAVEGPPALAVLMARLGTIGDPPDVVVSGINPGLNVGRAVYHSGTVGAALTARIGGINGIAVSQHVRPGERFPHHWSTAADLAAAALRSILDSPPKDPAVLNLNVPDAPRSELRGIRLCEVADNTGAGALSTEMQRRGDGSYTVVFSYDGSVEPDVDADVDIVAVRRGEVAVSWLGRITLTDPGDPSVDARIEALWNSESGPSTP